MTMVVCDTYEAMSRKACELAAEAIPPDRECLISFPGGDTPVGMVACFVRMVNSGGVDISRTRYVSLDEWVGLGSDDKGSCGYFNKTSLLDRLDRPFLDVHIINGAAENIEEERKDLDHYISRYGPLELSVLGIGLNGHLGFNEDGVDFDLDAHIIPLSPTTKKVMGKYFEKRHELTRGITQGLRQIMAARRILLIASGAGKRDILARAFHGPVDRSVPASILQRHPNCFVVCDKEAGAGL
ncbi:MAG: glucosamine-6-phosphate deaminase [Spirochaetaceae bacterium]|jgi:glucosamine-6-phosphate deaminase|nr:glucosamine-6-phosphate deaminase [Spirochaetaceae bacterium]